MNSVTEILQSMQAGREHSAEDLLPLVYDQLRRLAAHKLAMEKPGQTLEATALVHEAFLRLVDSAIQTHWESRKHFFGAAAESMRRILVENARRKKSLKRGDGLLRQEFDETEIAAAQPTDDLIALDDALAKLEALDKDKAELVKLRYFCGFTNLEAARLLNVSEKTAERYWTYARAWLARQIEADQS